MQTKYEDLPNFKLKNKCPQCGSSKFTLSFHKLREYVYYDDECNICESHIDRSCIMCGFILQQKLKQDSHK